VTGTREAGGEGDTDDWADDWADAAVVGTTADAFGAAVGVEVAFGAGAADDPHPMTATPATTSAAAARARTAAADVRRRRFIAVTVARPSGKDRAAGRDVPVGRNCRTPALP
jgi:hypothetical protein